MTTTDIARRVYDHTWKLDPIVRTVVAARQSAPDGPVAALPS